ncbi:MAG TPA: hypothetical protein VNA20_08465 [Frankiaceae bacterium]|nr:hypothetical protein [Frankiaceae bacterium]
MVLLLLRTLPWRAFALATAAGAVLVALRPEVDMLRATGVLLAAAAALFCDDPAEALTDATPTPRVVRRAARWAAGALAAYAGWLVLLPLVDGVDVAAVAGDVALLLVVSLAAGAVVGGPAAAPVLVVTLMAAQRLSPHFAHVRPALLVLGAGVLAAALRDPAARRRGTPVPAGDAA